MNYDDSGNPVPPPFTRGSLRMKPVLLLDCDGPLGGFTQSYLRAIASITGEHHDHTTVDRWDIHKCDFFLKLEAKFPDLRKRVDAQVSAPGFCENIEVQPGAQAAVEQLADLCEIYVVTSPWESATWMYERSRWVAKHFPISGRRVMHTADKHLVRGDIFVDDKPSHVEAWTTAWPEGRAILFDMGHNRGFSARDWRGGWPQVIAAAQVRSTR